MVSSDGLTRTTLQIEGGAPEPALTLAVRALQRVPGVLLAEINAATARANVAHDAAVSTSALLAAVAGTGMRATIVGNARPPAEAGAVAPQPRVFAPSVRFMRLAALLFAGVAFADIFVPRLAANHWLFAALLCAFWAAVFARSLLGRRR